MNNYLVNGDHVSIDEAMREVEADTDDIGLEYSINLFGPRRSMNTVVAPVAGTKATNKR